MDSQPASSSIDREEIDRVLQQRRKQREPKSCYPCRQRKIRCDHDLPCRACRKRGHPQICAYNVSSGPRSRRTASDDSRQSVPSHGPRLVPSSPEIHNSPTPENHTATATRITQNPSLQNPSQTPLRDHHCADLGECIYSGENSVVSILRLRTQDPNGDMAREAGSVLGLQNSYTSYPFMDWQTPQARWATLLKILPQRKEVLK